MSFQDNVKKKTDSIRNLIERIDMHTETDELGGPDYDTIDSLTDLIEGSLGDIRELIEDINENGEAEDLGDNCPECGGPATHPSGL